MSFAAMAAAANANMLASFGEAWTIADGTPAGKAIIGVYDGPFERVAIGVGVASYGPRLTVLSAEVTGLTVQGTALTRAADGQGYLIAGVEPDRQGLTVLILTEAEA